MEVTLNVRTKFGASCQVRISSNALVVELKTLIAKKLILSARHFELFLDGRLMLNKERLREFPIKGGTADIFASVGLKNVEEDNALVCVLDSESREHFLVSSKRSSVGDLKAQYLSRNDVKLAQPDDISIVYEGKVLSDGDELSKYGIGSEKISYVFVASRVDLDHDTPNPRALDVLAGNFERGLVLKKKDSVREHAVKIFGFGADLVYSVESPEVTVGNLKSYFRKHLEKKARGSVFLGDLSLTLDGEVLDDSTKVFSFAREGVTLLDATSDVSAIREKQLLDSYRDEWEMKKQTDAMQKSIARSKRTFPESSQIGAKRLSQFHQLDDISKEEKSLASKKAASFTRELFSKEPSGDLDSDGVTATHILRNLFAQANDEVVFYDSTKGFKLMDSSASIQDLFLKDKPMILRLDSAKGLAGLEGRNEPGDGFLVELQAAIDANTPHPTLEDVKLRIARSLDVTPDRVRINQVFSGSVCFNYTVNDLSNREKQSILQNDTTGKMRAQFPQFLENRIHPLLFRPAFDIAVFDPRGNKSFVSEGCTFQVGHPKLKRTYTQPKGWVRFGLRVLVDNAAEDVWLHPFGNPGNWWRAFHGTKNAGRYMSGVDSSIPEQMTNAAVNAMAGIHQGGFHSAHTTAYGPGVYCSPDPAWMKTSGYVATVPLHLQGGSETKNFLVMLQVAVKPGNDTLQPGTPDRIWAVKNPEHIRAYGILFREV